MSGSKAGAAKVRKGRGRGGPSVVPTPVARPANASTPAPSTPLSPPTDAGARDGEYVVQLPTFEGPLDLLLHLIQQHELDILDIPVSFVTEKYLEYLKVMRLLSIDLASEYLVMAATLAHIKSKMLLPSVPSGQDDDGMPGEDEEDPRAELVRRLLEYQKYKVAAGELTERGTLGRDVFSRGMTESEVPKGPAPFAATNVFSLLDAFERVLKRANVQIDHEVVFDRISITDRIVELTEKLSARRAMRFEDLLLDGVAKGGVIPRFEIVITFLALLEMCKLKLIRVHQTDPLSTIHIELSVNDGAPAPDFSVDTPAVIESTAADRVESAASVADASEVEVEAVEVETVEVEAVEGVEVEAVEGVEVEAVEGVEVEAVEGVDSEEVEVGQRAADVQDDVADDAPVSHVQATETESGRGGEGSPPDLAAPPFLEAFFAEPNPEEALQHAVDATTAPEEPALREIGMDRAEGVVDDMRVGDAQASGAESAPAPAVSDAATPALDADAPVFGTDPADAGSDGGGG